MADRDDRVRRWLARAALAGALLLGVFVWTGTQPVAVTLAFGVGPTLRATDGLGLDRGDVVQIHVRLVDADGRPAARSVLDLRTGISGPVTPPIVLRLPAGSYGAVVVLEAADGRRAERLVKVEFIEPGYQRVDLD